ncbi:MAG: hypothetical protein ACXWC4_06065 [Telluria sp.]
MTILLPRFIEAIRAVDLPQVTAPECIPEAFVLAREGRLATCYLPFESVNAPARLVIVGITPGFNQWKNAMAEAQRQLQRGAADRELLHASRLAGAFSGAIRPNLVALLDAIGVQRWLGIASCATIFGEDAGRVQVTSVLRHAVFVNGKNYSGAPPMTRTPFLQQQILEWFAPEAAQLRHAVFIPMGSTVSEALDWLAACGIIDASRILHGLPHPSGANAERVAYFLGRKDKATLSANTNGEQLDATRAALVAQMGALIAAKP